MKRTALLFLMVVYLISCLGIGVNRFYCCGKLASVTFTYASSQNTGKKAAKNNNCCKNEVQSFKVNDSHFNTASFTLDHQLPVFVVSNNHRRIVTIVNTILTKVVYQINVPPGHSGIAAYTFNCTYRI